MQTKTDLIDALRDRAYSFKVPDKLVAQAADEIERLRRLTRFQDNVIRSSVAGVGGAARGGRRMAGGRAMSDESEPSAASAGSVAGKPVAFRVDVEGIGSIMPLCQDWIEVQGILNRFGDRVFGVAPLYEEQPTLTETERLAIEWAAVIAKEQSQVAVHKTLRGLLERMK